MPSPELYECSIEGLFTPRVHVVWNTNSVALRSPWHGHPPLTRSAVWQDPAVQPGLYFSNQKLRLISVDHFLLYFVYDASMLPPRPLNNKIEVLVNNYNNNNNYDDDDVCPYWN